MVKRELEKLLYAYPYLKAENRNIALEIEKLEVIGFRNISYDFKPKSSGVSSIVETEVINRDKEIKKLKEKLNTNIKIIEQIDNSLEVLGEYEREIIIRIYFKRYRNNQIAQQLYVSHIYVSRIKNIALKKISSILN